MNQRSNNNKNLKLREQHQLLTSDLFAKIVNEEIDRCFNERYLTDVYINDIIYEHKYVTEKELKQEMFDLFFKSYSEICNNIKNTKIGDCITAVTPTDFLNSLSLEQLDLLKKNYSIPVFISPSQTFRSTNSRTDKVITELDSTISAAAINDDNDNNISAAKTKKIELEKGNNDIDDNMNKCIQLEQKIRIWWYYSHGNTIYPINIENKRAIEAYKHLSASSSKNKNKNRKIFDNEGYFNTITMNIHQMYVYFIGYTLVDADEEKEEGEGEENIIDKSTVMVFEEKSNNDKEDLEEERKNYEHEWQKVIKYKKLKFARYTINLNSRINLIVNYVFDKHIFTPIIEQSKGLREKIEEERHTFDKDGKEIYLHDWYNISKVFIQEWIQMAKSKEQRIWRPNFTNRGGYLMSDGHVDVKVIDIEEEGEFD